MPGAEKKQHIRKNGFAFADNKDVGWGRAGGLSPPFSWSG